LTTGPSKPFPAVARGTNRDFAAVAGLFIANGLAVGVFGGSLPGQRAHLSLAPGHIVGVLVTTAVVAVFSMNLSGAYSDRRGARLPALAGGTVMAVGAVLMGLAPDYGVLLLGAAVFGLGNGAMDVAMNALGVSVEHARRRPVMSRLHASFSIGNLVGALLVVAFGWVVADVAPRWPLWSSAVLLVVLLGALAGITPQSPRRAGGGESPGRGAVPAGVWLLAAMAVCFGMTEGTAIDWSSLHVTDVGDVSPSAGAWGLACVSGFMVVIRLFGDTVVERVGRVAVVRFGAACALVGYGLTAFLSALPVILVGWCLVGLGVGLLAPQIYGLAGHIGGARGLGFVVSFGYAAFLVGPALIGFVAAHANLQRAMLVPVVTAVGLIVLSARLPADPVEPEA
jgi:MFS family permease